MRMRAVVAGLLVTLAGGAGAETNLVLRQQVRQAESGFAKAMADRDHARFTSYLAEDAVFFGNGGSVHRGKAAVAASWRPLFEKPQAPFSWEPRDVDAGHGHPRPEQRARLRCVGQAVRGLHVRLAPRE